MGASPALLAVTRTVPVAFLGTETLTLPAESEESVTLLPSPTRHATLVPASGRPRAASRTRTSNAAAFDAPSNASALPNATPYHRNLIACMNNEEETKLHATLADGFHVVKYALTSQTAQQA